MPWPLAPVQKDTQQKHQHWKTPGESATTGRVRQMHKVQGDTNNMTQALWYRPGLGRQSRPAGGGGVDVRAADADRGR